MSKQMVVQGFRVYDEEWRRMTAVQEACVSAQVKIPLEVIAYFDGTKDGQPGYTKLEFDVRNSIAVKEWEGDEAFGVEVDLTKLPMDVKTLRVYVQS